jgi:hypothetical protein
LADLHNVVVRLADAQGDRRDSPASTLSSNSTLNDAEKTDTENRRVSNVNGVLTIQALRAEFEADAAATGPDSVHVRKSKIINKAIQDIGMGRYRWQLFVICCFGSLADRPWLQTAGVVLPFLSAEFGISESPFSIYDARYTAWDMLWSLLLGRDIRHYWKSTIISSDLPYYCGLWDRDWRFKHSAASARPFCRSVKFVMRQASMLALADCSMVAVPVA